LNGGHRSGTVPESHRLRDHAACGNRTRLAHGDRAGRGRGQGRRVRAGAASDGTGRVRVRGRTGGRAERVAGVVAASDGGPSMDESTRRSWTRSRDRRRPRSATSPLLLLRGLSCCAPGPVAQPATNRRCRAHEPGWGPLAGPPGRIRWLIGPECCVAGSERALAPDAAGSGAPSGAARTRSVAPCATGAGNGRRERVRDRNGPRDKAG